MGDVIELFQKLDKLCLQLHKLGLLSAKTSFGPYNFQQAQRFYSKYCKDQALKWREIESILREKKTKEIYNHITNGSSG